MPKNASYSLLILSFLFFLSAAPALCQSARQTIVFNDGWLFYKGDVDASKESFDDGNWRKVNIPHDWSIEGPFEEQWASATAYLPGGIGWYRKTFSVPQNMKEKNLAIYFDGVYKNSEVWINGQYLGKRPNGFIPFQYDITKHLHANGKNIIAVKVDHTEFADSRWYTGSGIYRNVYLVATNPVSIDQWGVSFSTPQVTREKALAKITAAVTNHGPAASSIVVKFALLDGKDQPVAHAQEQLHLNAGASAMASSAITVPRPMLWSTASGALYKLVTTIYSSGKKLDDNTQLVGFRSIRFDKDHGFFLNEENLKLKGVCIHDDAGALGVAVPEAVWERRLQLLKEAGCNSIRMSHNPHADYMYTLCDRMGLLVMDEAFDEWELGKNKWIKGWNVGTPGQQGYHESFKEWGERDVKDMVLCNRNHPSIILWSIGNEIDYPNDPYTHEVLSTGNNPQIYGKGYMAGHPPASRLGEIAAELVKQVKEIDTSRPVTAALAGVVMSNETSYPEALDVVGYNYQEFRYAEDHAKYPNRIIYGSENSMSGNAWDAVANNEFIAGQYLWTGIDYLGEARQWPSRSSEAGLLDLAGFKKPEFYFRQSLWTSSPMIYIGTGIKSGNGRRGGRNAAVNWNYNPGDSIQVNCFTNCEEAELFLNGQSLGKKQAAKEHVLTWEIVYQPGDLVVNAMRNGAIVSRKSLKTAGTAFGFQAVPYKSSSKKTAQVEISIVDKEGIPVYKADNEISLSIEGPGRLLGLESGSSVSHENYQSDKRKALHGKLIAYIELGEQKQPVTLVISSEGLTRRTVSLR